MTNQTAGEPDGYRAEARGGPRIRADIVDVYIFRRPLGKPGTVEFLQLLRTGEPMGGTWQPVMGHIEPGETAPRTARRELAEEVGLAPGDPSLLGMWALEQVHPYYIAAIECIVLSPRFAAEVAPAWEPVLNSEHSAHRWVAEVEQREHAGGEVREPARGFWFWPGQRSCVREILRDIVDTSSLSRERLRLP